MTDTEDPDRDAADLDFWSGRGRGGSVGQDPDPPAPKPYRSSRLARLRLPSIPWKSFPRKPDGLPGRRRPVVAAALLAALAGAWILVGHQSHGSPSTDGSLPASAPPSSIAATPTIPTTIPSGGAIALKGVITTDCTGLSAAEPHVLCLVDDVFMEMALYTRATVGAAFRRVAGAQMKAGAGPAACAAGRPDERAWSIASAPQYAIGRYVCRLEGGRAAIWWTHGDRLLHSVAGNPQDANLAKLFAWWRAHPSA